MSVCDMLSAEDKTTTIFKYIYIKYTYTYIEVFKYSFA